MFWDPCGSAVASSEAVHDGVGRLADLWGDGRWEAPHAVVQGFEIDESSLGECADERAV